MAIIVACDPGGIKPGTHSGTGYAVLNTENMRILHMQIDNHDPNQCVRMMQEMRDEFFPDHIVAEGFVPRYGTPFKLDSVYLIGAMQGFFGHGLKLVLPSQHTSKDPKKAAVPVHRLTALMKAQGYKVQQGHSRMALSVAVYYAGFVIKDKTVLDWLSKES